MQSQTDENNVNARTRLLESYSSTSAVCGSRSCSHGTFSPGPSSSQSREHSTNRTARDIENTRRGINGGSQSPTRRYQECDGILSAPLDAADAGRSATKQLADIHGVKNRKIMYLAYYVPFFNWVTQYRWRYLRGDILSAITVASIYIPMALSLASNVAHLPAINGLYAFIFHPLAYAIFGSSPLLVVGPEAPGSLLVGAVIRSTVDDGKTIDDDVQGNSIIAGVVAGMAGAMILIGGLTRLGFLDNILSRPFLRGFISAIGFVIFVDQLIPEMGLSDRAKDVQLVTHGSSADKLTFLFENVQYSHKLTCAVSFSTFVIIMLFRTLKKHLEPRFPNVVFVPDQFFVVFISAILTWQLGWDKKGLAVLGDVKGIGNRAFKFEWPFKLSRMEHLRDSMSTAFIISLLGFFESSVAAKGLRSVENVGIQGIPYSPNRELVALGVANVLGGCFMALPSFGGYGRKECPHDIRFFIRIRGWAELTLMLLIFFSTVFYSLYVGIALGMGLSILQIIRHSTKPRIQILGKVHGTRDKFENAEMHPEHVEFIEGCLIVKIPEPLTFANTGDLKNRLRRLEFYGTTAAHPALPRVRSPEHNKNIIFDIHGVTSIDGSGIQVLCEIIEEYVAQGVRVFFCRTPLPGSDVFQLMEKSGIIDTCGGKKHFVTSVDEALRLTEMQNIDE
ncbi:hypothetical protein FQN57_005750 [Myotisia sp. PD_48]|nr:hypothetical protein FQN57_005750 [Myotisia sp. PD_48]